MADADRRREIRELTRACDVRSQTQLPDGTVLEGVIDDVSMHGARIAGPTAGLSVGDHVKTTFVFLSNEKVGYEGVVRHVDTEGGYFGIEFTGEPIPIVVHRTHQTADP